MDQYEVLEAKLFGMFTDAGAKALDYAFPFIMVQLSANALGLTNNKETAKKIVSLSLYLQGAWILAHSETMIAEGVGLGLMGLGAAEDFRENVKGGAEAVGRRLYKGASRVGGWAKDPKGSYEGFRAWIDVTDWYDWIQDARGW